MKFIRVAVLLFLLTFAAAAYPAEKTFSCKPAKELMLEQLVNGYGYMATAIANPNIVTQFYINVKTGEWRVIGIDSDLNACVMLTGSEWQFAMVKEASL